MELFIVFVYPKALRLRKYILYLLFIWTSFEIALRALSAVPAHAMFGAIMGIFIHTI